jgi:membrane associated rhomboid family serine protease
MHNQTVQYRIGGPITPVVKKLMIANAAIFLVQLLADRVMPGFMENTFGLNYTGLVQEYRLWQPATYMFLHGGWLHIIFNLLGLWMFGGDIEQLWGSRRFLRYYLFTGIGAGLFIALMNYVVHVRYGTGYPYVPTTIGASGAIYGILLAYGVTWPNREVLLYFLFPVKMKYLVLIFGLIEFFGTLSGGAGGTISHIGHLGGLLSGLVFIVYQVRAAGRPKRRSAKGRNGFFGDFMKKRRLRTKQREIATRIEAKKTIDDLLDKIAREGMSSLSTGERKRLDWARRHYTPDEHVTYH